MAQQIPQKSNGQNDWVEYRKLVIQSLDDLKTEQTKIRDAQVQILLDVRGLKVKATLYGGIGGFIVSTLIGLAVAFLI